MANLTIELPKKLEKRLTYLEIVSKQPKNFIVQEALIRYLENAEDICDALERSQKESKTYTTEELLEELGLKNV
jgi:predicted DNA-binding protein